MSAPIPDEQAALLAAIVAEPDADAPRLVYADWLQEHGDEEQAEFIRNSIKLALMKPKGKTWNALAERLEIRWGRASRWLAALGLEKAIPSPHHRGFPEQVTYDGPNEFFAEAAALFQFVPVRELVIKMYRGSHLDDQAATRLAELPGLAQLTHLSLIDQPIRLTGCRTLFRSPHLAGLIFLNLGGCNFISDAEVMELASSPSLTNLTGLVFSHCSIGVAGLRAILESPSLRKLKELHLGYCFFGREDGEDGADEVVAALQDRFGSGLHLRNHEELTNPA